MLLIPKDEKITKSVQVALVIIMLLIPKDEEMTKSIQVAL